MYVQVAVMDFGKNFAYVECTLPTRAEAPLKARYRNAIGITEELWSEEATYHQLLIGVLRWMVGLGRMDTWLEVTMIASHLAMSSFGHLEQVYYTLAYIKKYHNAEIVL